MKRTLCLFLALILAVGICFSAPVTITASAAFTLESGEENTVGAEYTDEESKFKYRITKISGDKAVAVIGFTGSGTEIEIPATVTINEIAYNVTTIDSRAFEECTALTSVMIPESVTKIGVNAFIGCTSLETITIPETLKTIGAGAFSGCTSLEKVKIPDSVTTIGQQTFSGCTSLSEVTIPNSVKTIGKDAFSDCIALTSIAIPDSVTTIGNSAFANCTALTSVTIPKDVTTIGASAFNGCTSLSAVTIGDGVTTIDDYAFSGCTALTTVTIPASVTSIDTYAFSGCTALTTITIPASVTSIVSTVFSGCTSLTSIEVDVSNSSYLSVEGVLFNKDKTELICYPAGKDATSYTILDSVTSIGVYAFSGCTSLASVTIPDSVTTIGLQAFYGCTSLTSVTIGKGVTTIGWGAFDGCTSLTSVTIPDSVTTIGQQAFGGCTSLTTVTIPDSVTTIGQQAFYGCTSLTSVTIGKGVTEIDNNAFNGCTNILLFVDKNNSYLQKYATDNNINYVVDGSGELGKLTFTPIYEEADNENSEITGYSVTARDKTISGALTIPSEYNGYSVTTIGDSAFKGCSELASVTIPDSITTIGSSAFNDCTSLTTIEIPDSVTSIGRSAFSTCTALTSVMIPESVTTIDNYTFYSCTALKSVTIPESVTSIGDYAFSGCTSLTSVTIPEIVTSIGDDAFGGCTSLTSVTIPESVTAIGDWAFSSCTELAEIKVDDGNTNYLSVDGILFNADKTELICYPAGKKGNYEIPTTVTEIAPGAFSGNTLLESVIIPDSVTTIGEGAFTDCTALTSVTIPDSVTTIGSCAFQGCTSLASVTIGDRVTTIGWQTFCDCTALTSVTIGKGVTEIDDDAFEGCASLTTVNVPCSWNENPKYTTFENNVTVDIQKHNYELGVCTACGEDCAHTGGTATCTTLAVCENCGDSYGDLAPHTYINGKCTAEGCGYACTHETITDGVCVACGGKHCGNTENDKVVWFYDEYTDTLTITGSDAMSDNEAPWLIEYTNDIGKIDIEYGVTSIGNLAFCGCENLTSVTIPKSVTTIGRYAFANCISLTTIEIPESVTSIGSNAFYWCTALTSVTIPGSVTSIGDYAFSNCTSLTSVEIPESVETIGKDAFNNCQNLTSITIPKNVTVIGEGAFCSCAKLTEINVDEGNTTYSSEDGVLFNANKTELICYPAGKEVNYEVPTTVTEIASAAFRGNTSLESVTIPVSVTSIGRYAFANCTSLTTIEIPESVTSIGSNAFQACSELTSVTIPESVTSIGNYAFYNCKKLILTVEPGSYAHNYAKTNSIPYIFNGYNEAETAQIEKLTFTLNDDSESYSVTDCDTQISGELKIPATYNGKPVTIIGDSAFESCESLTSVTIPDSVTTIGRYAFNCTSLTSVTIPDSVKEIYAYAFENCTKLTSVTIPDGVTTIGESAFYGCSELETITIPKSVTSIGDNAFDGCDKLSTVNVPCSWNENPKYTTFANSVTVDIPKHNYELGVCTACKYDCTHETPDENGICTVCYIAEGTCGEYVTWIYDSKTTTLTISGSGAMADYEGDNKPWNSFKSQITNVIINNGVTTIGNYAFGECSNLKSITIPETVTTIGQYAFYGCTKLTSVTIPDSVTTISANAFNGCSGLESVTIGNKVESIGERAFYGCSALTSVTFGENVTSLGNFAFANCTSLTTITLPDSVTSIGDSAFKNCASLTTIKLPKEIASISQECFYGCSILKSITIPDSVKTIGANAFYECTSLETITIPKSVEAIGNNAFYNCTNVLLFVDKNNSAVQTYAITNNVNYIVDGSGELDKLTFTPIRAVEGDDSSEITGYSVTDCDTSILGALTIPSEFNGKPVTKIGYSAFVNCESLTSVVIPNSVVSLGEKAFYLCGGLETVTLSSNITVIPNDAFAYCESLKTLPITENVTSIGERAFYASGNLGSVSLSNVTIGSRAFLQCGITELTLENCKLNDASVFINNDIEKLTLSETDIPDEMFDGDSYIKTLVAEDSVLGSRSFKGCHSLKSVTVFGGEIKSDAFLACPSLETVTIDNIDSVGGYAFNNCQALKTVEVNATEISEYAFSMCTSLENVKLGDNVEVIRDAVFEGCDSLAELELPETVTEIGKWVFNGCNLLTELVIPESVTDVSANAFVGCYNLKYIFFEGTEDSQKELGDALVTNAKIHYGSSTHTFNENYTVDKEPTCTEVGSESQHCKYCDLTQNERPVKELGHTPVNGGTQGAHTKCDVCGEPLSTTHTFTSKVTTVPTCTEDGVETFTCECGYSYSKPVAKLGHDLVSHAGKAATCTEKGYYPYNTCSRCDYTTYKEIAKLGHNIVIDKAVEATCTKTGLTEGSHCTRCNGATVAQNVVKATGHKLTLVGKKEPTFKAEGHTGSEVCSVCNEIINVGSVIKKLSFTTPEVTAVANKSGIKVNWNKVENAERYVLYKRVYDASAEKWSKWKIINADLTTLDYLDTDVVLGAKYRYTVRAKNGDTLSEYKSTSTVKYNVTPTVKVANATGGIKVSWSTAANATGYRVYRSTLSNGKWSNWKNMGTAAANKTSWTDKSVKSDVTYKYTVRAVYNKVLSSYNKNGASVLFLTAPTVKIANVSNGVKVTWNKITGASGYYVYSAQYDPSTKKWSGWTNRGTVTKTSWTDKKVESGVKYRYTVRAIKGKTLSAYKATGGLIYLLEPTVKIANASTGIKVTWSQCDGATGYTVYRSEYNTKTKKWSKWKNRGTAAATKSSWTDKYVTSGKNYKYTVRAVNGDFKSSYVSSDKLLYLAQPKVTVKAVSNGINVAWSKSAGAKGYIVYRSELVNGEWSKWKNMGTAKAEKSSWTDKSAKAGVTYKYTVRAVNNGVKSTYKASTSVVR